MQKEELPLTDLEEICSGFDQGRPVLSYTEVCLPNKPPTPKNIGQGLKGPQRQFWKECLFVKYEKNKNFSLLSAPISTNPPLPLATQK